MSFQVLTVLYQVVTLGSAVIQWPCFQTQVVVHIGLDFPQYINDATGCMDNKTGIFCHRLDDALRSNVLSNRCLLLYKDQSVDQFHNMSHVRTLVLASSAPNKTFKITFANDNSSLVFWDSQRIHVLNIDFIQSEDILLPGRAVYFHHASELKIANVTFYNFAGYALFITLNELAGSLNLTQLTVTTERNLGEISKGIHIETISNARCHISISHSIFKNLKDVRNDTDCSKEEQSLCGKGAGLSLVFRRSPSNVRLDIFQAHFIDNEAFIGAGMYIEVSTNLSVHVSDTNFVSNKANLSGGGIMFTTGNDIFENDALLNGNNTIYANSLNFTNNTADRGGGLAFWNIHYAKLESILQDSSFSESKARSCGADIYAVRSALSFINVNTTSCKCINEPQKRMGFSSVAIYDALLTIYSANIFNHKGSGIILDLSNLVVKGVLHIKNNEAYLGGGLALFKNSFITLTNETDLQIEHNHAVSKGGGMYVSSSFLSKCFFVNYRNFTGSVRFSNNTSQLGKAVYTNSLRSCSNHFYVNKTFHNVLTGWKHFIIGCKEEEKCISTDPSDIDFHLKDPNNIRPGIPHPFKISMRDERDRLDRVPFSAYIQSTNNTVYFFKKSPWSVGRNNTLTFYGAKKEFFRLTLFASFYLTRTLENEFQLVGCSWYQKLSNDSSCICKGGEELSKLGILRCSNEHIYLARNKWINVGSKSKVHDCPVGYCSSDSPENKYVPGEQCHSSRDQQSILCSKCKANYSLVFGETYCYDCRGRQYDFVKIVALTLAINFLIVIFVLTLNKNSYAGYLNPFIFSYRFIPLLVRNTRLNEQPERIFSFFNRGSFMKSLDSFFCVNGLNDLQRLWLDLGLALSWFVYLLILYQLCTRWQLLFTRNAFYRSASVLAMVVFFNFMEFALRVFHQIEIDNSHRVFAYAAESFRSVDHTLLIVAGAIVILVVFFCLVASFLEDSSCTWSKYCIPQCLKPFFRHNFFEYGTWFLVLRYLLFTIFLVLGEYNYRNIWMSLVILVKTVLNTMLKPYQNTMLNLFEIVLLFNVLVIGILTETISDLDLSDYFASSLVRVLCYLPLGGLVGLIFITRCGIENLFRSCSNQNQGKTKGLILFALC